jgi:hypothetical protein
MVSRLVLLTVQLVLVLALLLESGSNVLLFLSFVQNPYPFTNLRSLARSVSLFTFFKYSSALTYFKATSGPLPLSNTTTTATCCLPPVKIKFLPCGDQKTGSVWEPFTDTREPFGIWMWIDSRNVS